MRIQLMLQDPIEIEVAQIPCVGEIIRDPRDATYLHEVFAVVHEPEASEKPVEFVASVYVREFVNAFVFRSLGPTPKM